MDFNAGTLVEGESMSSVSRRFIDLICAVAGGQLTQNEKHDNRGIAIFKTGVTL